MNYNSIIEDLIINENKYKTDKIIPLNNNKPIFSKADFEIIEGEPIYFEPDEYGRSNGGIAFLRDPTNEKNIINKAKLVHKQKINSIDIKYLDNCVNYKLLEEKCIEYNKR